MIGTTPGNPESLMVQRFTHNRDGRSEAQRDPAASPRYKACKGKRHTCNPGPLPPNCDPGRRVSASGDRTWCQNPPDVFEFRRIKTEIPDPSRRKWKDEQGGAE